MSGKIKCLLDQQFSRLSKLEQRMMYWLAIEREPVTTQILQEDLVEPILSDELEEALKTLQWRSLIERSGERYTLQNVITEYLTEQLIKQMYQEIASGKIDLLQHLVLIKSTSKMCIRKRQVQLILEPLVHKLLKKSGKVEVESRLQKILAAIQGSATGQPGYAVENLFNLLRYLERDACQFNFSDLIGWQAHPSRARQEDVNLLYRFGNEINTRGEVRLAKSQRNGLK